MPIEQLETKCSVCRTPQVNTSSGVTCANGHGGAPAFEDKEDLTAFGDQMGAAFNELRIDKLKAVEQEVGAVVVAFDKDGFVYGEDLLTVMLAQHWDRIEAATDEMLLVYDPLTKKVVYGKELLITLMSNPEMRDGMRLILRHYEAAESKARHPF